MSYEDRRAQSARDDRYLEIKNRIPGIKAQVQGLLTDAENLRSESPDAAEKDEVAALRDLLTSALRTVLKV